jgi:hypothetical protein
MFKTLDIHHGIYPRRYTLPNKCDTFRPGNTASSYYYQNEREDWHPPFFIVFGLLISLHKKGNLRKQSIAFYAGKISRADSHDIQTGLT